MLVPIQYIKKFECEEMILDGALQLNRLFLGKFKNFKFSKTKSFYEMFR